MLSTAAALKGLALILILCLLPATSVVHAQGYKVDNIAIEGNETFSDGVLRDQMSMYTINFLQDLLGKDHFYFSEEILRSDLTRIRQFYQREGFLLVDVQASRVERDAEDESVRLTITVQEHTPVDVGDVDYRLQLNQPSDSDFASEIVAECWPARDVHSGRRFRDELVRNDRRMIDSHFVNAGYPYVDVDYTLEVDAASNTVDVVWDITPGPRTFFGGVSITGNEYVSEDLIRRYVVFDRGDLFRQQLINESQNRIFELGMFHVVVVKALLERNRGDSAAVEITIEEAPRLSTRFGLGYGDEEKFRAFSNSRLLDFLGRGRRLDFDLKHSDIEPYGVSVTVTQPLFLSIDNSLVINPHLRKQEEPAYTVRRIGGRVRVDRRFGQYLNGYVGYGVERVSLDTNSVAVDVDTIASAQDLYNKSAVIVGMSYDNALPRFNPSGGFNTTLSLTYTGVGFSSDFQYVKVVADVRTYQKVAGMVLALKLKAGSIEPTGEDDLVPVEDRFYAGGNSSVRGWDRYRLGPVDSEGQPRGGKSLIEAGVELRYPIWGDFGGAVFYDLGNVWTDPVGYALGELEYAAGGGLRYQTPIGPVRVDVGWPVFSDKKRAEFFLSVGHAF
ncbi:outer membrane protein assembly factor BamA [candidate division GN15 bacterium]|nr:outer membrane protein assembly factor BamA [candidate division GN15 bacterium]